VWENHAQCGDCGGGDPQPVETIGKIHFDHENRSKAAVGMANFVESAIQGPTKLHCFHGCKWDSVSIDATEGQVNDDTVTTIPLWYHS
jgi:hypothetical protein